MTKNERREKMMRKLQVSNLTKLTQEHFYNTSVRNHSIIWKLHYEIEIPINRTSDGNSKLAYPGKHWNGNVVYVEKRIDYQTFLYFGFFSSLTSFTLSFSIELRKKLFGGIEWAAKINCQNSVGISVFLSSHYFSLCSCLPLFSFLLFPFWTAYSNPFK